MDAVDEQQTVRQPGQRVVQGTVADLLLEDEDAGEGVVEPGPVREGLDAHEDAAASSRPGSSWFSTQNAATTTGSNWSPAQRLSSANAVGAGSASR